MKSYTEDQIRQAGKDGEISLIDVEHLISILTYPDKFCEAKEEGIRVNWIDINTPFNGPVFDLSERIHSAT